MSNKLWTPKIGQKVIIGEPADKHMNKSYIGYIGTVIKSLGHHIGMGLEYDLWEIALNNGKTDAFYTEELMVIV